MATPVPEPSDTGTLHLDDLVPNPDEVRASLRRLAERKGEGTLRTYSHEDVRERLRSVRTQAKGADSDTAGR